MKNSDIIWGLTTAFINIGLFKPTIENDQLGNPFSFKLNLETYRFQHDLNRMFDVIKQGTSAR